MRRLLSALAGLALILSLGIGSVAHALEAPGCVETAQASPLHADGDADQVPADGEKGYPHHHAGCQGHQFAAAVEHRNALAPTTGKDRLPIVSTRLLVASGTDPGLRPPIA